MQRERSPRSGNERHSSLRDPTVGLGPMPEALIPEAQVTIAGHYNGPVAFANDLDNY